MKQKNIFTSLVLLSLFVFACTANQALTQTTPEQVSGGSERIVELYVEGCQ